MRKQLKLLTIVLVVFVATTFVGCSKKAASINYETYIIETFEGELIQIDESNIVSQQKVKDVLETDLVPANAEVIAPGRDFVYLADDSFYYIEDTTNNLLTIAAK